MLDEQKIARTRRRGSAVMEALDAYQALDDRRRSLQGRLDEKRKQRNDANARMRDLDKKSQEFAAARDQLRSLSQEIKAGEIEFNDIESQEREIRLQIPNAPHKSVHSGTSEDDNQEVDRWGQQPVFDFEPKNHWDVGEELGILDFESATNKLSGARFCVLREDGAKLNRALINFMIDLHREGGYSEVWPPALLLRKALEGTGQLPKFEDDAFKTQAGDRELFLSPTAEVSLTNLHREEILARDQLPIHYVAYSPCFRAEAGSYGKDTRGLIRQHQFDKVELVRFVTPETSYQALEELRRDAERVLQTLGLFFRTVRLCTSDLGFSASKTYDLEVWLPGQNAFREISSCSNCEDFQAKRAKIRYRPEPGAKPRALHTLNGSGLAVGRTIVAILEQNQRADGSVKIPDALVPYMGGQTELVKGSP